MVPIIAESGACEGARRGVLAVSVALALATATAGCKPSEPPEPECGNGVLEAGEACDDFNPFDGDGCSAECVVEKAGPVCGDGEVEAPEVCDDFNNVDGDACSADCSKSLLDLDCQGSAYPSTAPDPVSLTGIVEDVGNVGVAGALVEVVSVAGDVVLATTTSDAAFAYALTYATGGTAIDVYRRATAAGYPALHDYPPFPPFLDLDWDLTLVDAATRDAFAGAVGVTPDPAAGTVVAFVFSCLPDPVLLEGATVAFSPAAESVVYLNAMQLPMPGATSTSTSGLAVGFNVPAGDVDVEVDLFGTTFRPRTVRSYADAFTFVARMP